MSRPLLLGHRGARAFRSVPENTLASFDRALADGCDGFEFDVRLTTDGQAVVSHDPKAAGVEIARAPARELPALQRLQEVLARYPKAFLDIELKVPGLEKIVIEALKDRADNRFVVSSFLPEVLRTIRSGNPSIPLGLICETRAELRQWQHVPVEYVIPHYELADQELIWRMKDAGKRIVVWTVNDADWMRRFSKDGVDGIIADDTRLLCGTLLAE